MPENVQQLKKRIKINFPYKMNYTYREAFKALRTNLQFSGTDVKAIVITSSDQSEGKSTVSIGIAKSLAELNKKVLFIDADLRKSNILMKYTNQTAVQGLSQFLSGQTDIDDVIYESQYPYLYFIFAGQYPPNPVELLSTKRFTNFIAQTKTVFDYVIIDTAPLGMVIDAAVIATVADGAIMVISNGKTSYRYARSVKEQLEKSGVKILGTVLNQVQKKSKGYYKKYYSKYYAYGYGTSKYEKYQPYNVSDEE